MPDLEKEIKESIEKLGKVHEEFKKDNDAAIKEKADKKYVDNLLEEKLTKLNEALSTSVEDKKKYEKELEEVKTTLNRFNANERIIALEGKDSKELKAAHNLFLRKGKEEAYQVVLEKELKEKDENKFLSVGSDPDGGYLVRPEMGDEIVKKIFESSPIRQIASIVTISSDAFELLRDLDEAGSESVGETSTRGTTSTPEIGMIRIPVHELHASPKATQKLLDDAAFDVESYLNGKIAEKFNRDEATNFVVGNGVNKAKGFLSYPNGTTGETIEQITSGASALPTSDELIDTFYALKEDYERNAVWLIKRAVVAEVRKLKDGQGQYLWAPGLAAGKPSILLGHEVLHANDMPAAAASSLSIAFGDFKAGYQIVDRLGIRILRDPFTNKPFVIFYTTKRSGGDVKDFEAIKINKFAA